MASVDSLPPDRRAVLQLVLQRGRSYDEIAQMLSIDRAAVRDRALRAFDALGPETRIPAEQRALITDYLLGQLPERVAEETRRSLARSANERVWARVVASELGTIAAGPLPEIPTEEAGAPEAPAGEPSPGQPAPSTGPVAAVPAAAGAAAAAPRRRFGRRGRDGGGSDGAGQAVSRRDGAILLGGAAVLIIAIIVAIILITSGGGSKPKATSTAANAPTTASGSTTAAQTTTSGATSTTAIKPLASVNLTSPQAGSKTKGVAIVVRQGSTTAIELAAQGVPANTSHDAYAVWLYNSPTDAALLGFVNPGVKSDGVLRTLGRLPANASHFKQLLVSRETQAKPHAPGPILLQGALNLPSA